MHSVALLTCLFAASAIAGPYHNKHADLHKRHPVEVVEMYTTVDWTYDTVTVTAGQVPTSTSQPVVKAEEYAAAPNSEKEEHHRHHAAAPATTSSAPVEAVTPTYGQQSSPVQQSTYVQPSSVEAVTPTYGQQSSSVQQSTYVQPSPVAKTSAAAAPVSSPQSAGSYQGTILDSHKTARAAFGHGELVWNETLASLAEYEAKAANCQMAHNLNDESGQSVAMGQNLAMGTDPDCKNGNYDKVAGQVELWFNEKKDYGDISNQFTSAPSSSAMSTGTANGHEILHFTQMVWKGTEQVGCYTVPDCSGSSLTFCNYYPAGNIANENDSNQYQSYLDNVGQPTS
ncbi:MAG: hypothetical protein M1828_005659 [Chrysothrix sp. TS-e1954]|nr:MAG: hypothetical protein M1828_005659 [Chrysothrix sp. TS-e1954]